MLVTVSTPPAVSPPAPEIDNGVIEEARRRQRRRRTVGIALGAGATAIAMSALLISGGGGGNAGAPGEPSPGSPLKLTLVHGRAFIDGQPALMGVTPSLEAGSVGVCVRVAQQGRCGSFPTAAYPVYGGPGGFSPKEKVGPEGEIDAIFTGPGVAGMRVAHLGTFRAEPAPGLPPGAKQIVFYRPPGSRGTVLPPGLSPQILQGFEHARRGPALTETLLDASGRAIPVGKSPTFQLPNSYWQWPQAPPAQGRCAMSSSLTGVRSAWGMVATRLAPDPKITTPGWLSCLDVWFSRGATSYEAAILLDAKSPGSTPAPLWGAIPVPGHPGIVEIPPVQRAFHLAPLSPAEAARILAVDTKMRGRARAEQILRESERRTFWSVLVPPTVARRVGPAWLLVRDGDSLAQRLRFLEGLHVTKLTLPRSR
ncbi:MAG: hypothetical protein ACHQE6_06870 [Solirubrobacterales bacterium]